MPKLTHAQRRDILSAQLLSGAIDADTWVAKSRQLERRFNVLGWALVTSYFAGLLVTALALIGGAYAFIMLVGVVAGTV